MLHLVPVTDPEVFFNINQKYLYEMTQFYDDPMDSRGNYHYGHFDSYFSGDPDRKALYLFDDDLRVGFAMLNRFSHLGDPIDRAMAEFTIFPAYRKHGLAREAATLLFGTYPGRWEIKYHVRNRKAAALWRQVSAAYHPKETRLTDEEMILSFSVPGDP